MRVFNFDLARVAAEYQASDWVYIPGGIDAEFLAYVEDYSRQHDSSIEMRQFAIEGKKKQGRFEMPAELGVDDILEPIASVTGLRSETLVLSERHLQIYDKRADPNPEAHKDRYSSQVSVGLSIVIPDGSSLVFYPGADRRINRGDKAVYEAIPSGEPVVIADRPGDILMFGGNSTWHLRRNSAGTVNLYFKVNEYDYDPLGEDPRRT